MRAFCEKNIFSLNQDWVSDGVYPPHWIGVDALDLDTGLAAEWEGYTSCLWMAGIVLSEVQDSFIVTGFIGRSSGTRLCGIPTLK